MYKLPLSPPFFATHTISFRFRRRFSAFNPVSYSSSTSAVVQKRKLIFHICFCAHIAVLSEISPLIIFLALLLQCPYELPFSFINLFYFCLLRCFQLYIISLTPRIQTTNFTHFFSKSIYPMWK